MRSLFPYFPKDHFSRAKDHSHFSELYTKIVFSLDVVWKPWVLFPIFFKIFSKLGTYQIVPKFISYTPNHFYN